MKSLFNSDTGTVTLAPGTSFPAITFETGTADLALVAWQGRQVVLSVDSVQSSGTLKMINNSFWRGILEFTYQFHEINEPDSVLLSTGRGYSSFAITKVNKVIGSQTTKVWQASLSEIQINDLNPEIERIQ